MKCFRLKTLVLLVAFSQHACSDRSKSLTGFEERSVTTNGSTRGYRVYIPKDRDPKVKLPVMLYLHGSGVRGDDNIAQADAFSMAIDSVREKIDFIVVIPQCPENTYWANAAVANYSLAALDATVNEFNGDMQRLYLAGFSLGGYGAWHFAAANPGKFAALMPVSGGVVGERPVEPRDRAVIIPEIEKILDSPDPYKALAGAIGQTPVWAFHGAVDESVPVEFTRKTVKALQEAGNKNVRYTEYPNEGHMIFSKAFSDPGFFEWIEEQRLPSRR